MIQPPFQREIHQSFSEFYKMGSQRYFATFCIFTSWFLLALGDQKLFCHVTNWSQYRPAPWAHTIDDINATLCTHLVYSFAVVGEDSVLQFTEPNYDLGSNGQPGAMKKLNDLKIQNDKLKTLLSVGGWNAGVAGFSKMAATNVSRSTFIQSTVDLLTKQGFDGIDICWLWPAIEWRGGRPEDKDNFMTLLREMREVFTKNQLLLVVTVSAVEHTIEKAYNASELSKSVDYIKVLTYDYHGSWQNFTHHHSPLYSSIVDESLEYLDPGITKMNMNYTMNYWMRLGVAPEKLILGVATYGRGFTAFDVIKFYSQIGVPAMGPNPPKAYTQSKGFMSYFEICDMLQNEFQWVPVEDGGVRAPFAFFQGGNTWVGYDDSFSAEVKGKYARENGFGGVMIWTLDMDDYRNFCGDGKHPLINAVRRGLGMDEEDASKPPETTAVTSTTTHTTPEDTEGTTEESTEGTTPETTEVITSEASTEDNSSGTKETTASTSQSTTEDIEETTATLTTATSTSSTAPAPTATLKSTTISITRRTSSESSTVATSTEASSTSTRTTPAQANPCQREGLNPNPKDCRRYWECRYRNGKLVRTQFWICRRSLVFSPRRETCTSPKYVRGCENYYN